MSNQNIVRTRFAVSPTGYMHVGGVRNAIFDWLVARQAGGRFVLRIEDTDQSREVQGAVDHIVETLHWLGLDWDEGIEVGGPQAPYVQSERLAIYKEWGQKLVDKGRAYADPYTAEQVQAFREQSKTDKKPFLYRNHRPQNPPVWDGTQPLRFKSDPKAYTWHDAVMGELSAGEEAVDDFILIKSDGFATYNFCHIIDDYLMGITHIIRSQEFIASVPKYLNLYEALDFPRPILASPAWIMRPDGKKKLSKRDGAKDVMGYARDGFLPETMLNFIVSLGWNDGTTQEIFSVEELIAKFDINRVQQSGAKFDEQRLLWMSGCHIRQLSVDDLYAKVTDFWPAESAQYDEIYKKSVLALIQERLKFFAEIPALSMFFFKDLPVNPELVSGHKQLSKLTSGDVKELLQQSRDVLAAGGDFGRDDSESHGDSDEASNNQPGDFTAPDLVERLNKLISDTGQKPVVLFSLIRIATTQAPASPGLADTLAVLGRQTVLRRIDQMLQSL